MRKINTRENARKLMTMALHMGELMLINGAETYRVEDSIERVCKSYSDLQMAEIFATPTVIIASISFDDQRLTNMIRVKSGGINLTMIHLLNKFSRTFVNEEMTVEEGISALTEIENSPDSASKFRLVYSTLTGPVFCVLFGGSLWDTISCFFVTLIMLFVLFKMRKFKVSFFFENFLGGFISSSLSYLAFGLGICDSLDMVIIGAIMPLVPGVAITNAVRDTLGGDYISGLSKFTEAIFIAFGIVLGVGTILAVYLTGGML
ncbi:MAG: threonine/serine exporter family protein [Tissierellia bacterium]|nr:threonine/serine exporter family protein [Tissierellia bacterium]